MPIEIEATYKDGVLKLEEPLPLENRQRVKVSIHEAISRAQASYGLIGWTGDPEVVRRIALDPDFSVQESP
jgi:predicted DNA-binding antitoxin AbrB/MazE fold protein